MNFFNYMITDFVGTIQGLDAGTFIASALKEGNILTPVVYLFVFLSIMKITHHVIVEKRYIEAGKAFIILFLFIVLFAFTGSYKVWNINITNGILEDQNNLELKYLANIDVTPNISNSYATVNSVPLMYSLLSVVDEFDFLVSKTMLSKKTLQENLLKQRLKVSPQDVVSLAYMDYVSKAKNASEMASRIKAVAHCYNLEEDISELLDDKTLSEGDKKVLQKLREDISKFPSVISAIPGIGTVSDYFECKKVRSEFSSSIKNVGSSVFNGKDSNDKIYREFVNGISEMAEEGMLPTTLKKQILNGLIMQKELIASLNNYYSAVRDDGSLINSISTFIDRAMSFNKYVTSEYFTSRSFYEWFMFKMQAIVLFVILALFPIIVMLAFLPAFGYNFRLLGSYMGAYFLIKLWIPIYLMAYQFLTSKMSSTIGAIVSFLLPTSAYAMNADLYTALISTLPEQEKFTNYILTTLAIAIPTALGGSALFLIGKDFYVASKTALAESMLTAKEVIGMFGRGINTIGGGGKISGSSASEVNTPSTVSLSQTLKTGTNTTIKTTDYYTRDEKTGLYVPTGSGKIELGYLDGVKAKSGIILPRYI